LHISATKNLQDLKQAVSLAYQHVTTTKGVETFRREWCRIILCHVNGVARENPLDN
jgi:hypothetical protein